MYLLSTTWIIFFFSLKYGQQRNSINFILFLLLHSFQLAGEAGEARTSILLSCKCYGAIHLLSVIYHSWSFQASSRVLPCRSDFFRPTDQLSKGQWISHRQAVICLRQSRKLTWVSVIPWPGP